MWVLVSWEKISHVASNPLVLPSAHTKKLQLILDTEYTEAKFYSVQAEAANELRLDLLVVVSLLTHTACLVWLLWCACCALC